VVDVLREVISDAIQCVVCFECCLAPVRQCLNGDVICGTCIETGQFTTCPVCKIDVANYVEAHPSPSIVMASTCMSRVAGQIRRIYKMFFIAGVNTGPVFLFTIEGGSPRLFFLHRPVLGYGFNPPLRSFLA